MPPADHDRRRHPGRAVALALKVEHLLELARDVAASAAFCGSGDFAGSSPSEPPQLATTTAETTTSSTHRTSTMDCLADDATAAEQRGQPSSSVRQGLPR